MILYWIVYVWIDTVITTSVEAQCDARKQPIYLTNVLKLINKIIHCTLNVHAIYRNNIIGRQFIGPYWWIHYHERTFQRVKLCLEIWWAKQFRGQTKFRMGGRLVIKALK